MHEKIKALVLIICICMSTYVVSAPLDKSIKVDIAMEKIMALIKSDKDAEALPFFAELEAMDTPLPESFYFYYIASLDKSNNVEKALSRSEDYLAKYGKNGKYYSKIIPIVSRLSMQHEKDKTYAAEMAVYERSMQDYEKYKSKKDQCDYELSYANRKQKCQNHIDKTGMFTLEYCLREFPKDHHQSSDCKYFYDKTIPNKPQQPVRQ